MAVDKLGAYDKVMGIFASLDGGILTDEEALDQIRKQVGAIKPLPSRIVLMGTLPFTVTIDTQTKDVEEFEINYYYPAFDNKAETRASGELIEIDAAQLAELIEAAEHSAGDWPDPERM